MRLKDRVVFITGASRGIGKACALACAREGADVAIAAKTGEPHPKLPGTIHDTAKEVEARGRRALPIQLDIRDAEACEQAIAHTLEELGQIDALINNAGALFWKDVTETPMKRFDLVMGVNLRSAFALSHAVLPHMIERRWGHIIMMSPPYQPEAVPHRGAYWISKFGMTMLAEAIAAECQEHNVAAHALWPATIIESQASLHFGLGDPRTWRKPEILADCVIALLAKEPSERSSKAWIDEDLLREEGVTDFTRYRCDPDVEPVKMTTLGELPASD